MSPGSPPPAIWHRGAGSRPATTSPTRRCGGGRSPSRAANWWAGLPSSPPRSSGATRFCTNADNASPSDATTGTSPRSRSLDGSSRSSTTGSATGISAAWNPPREHTRTRAGCERVVCHDPHHSGEIVSLIRLAHRDERLSVRALAVRLRVHRREVRAAAGRARALSRARRMSSAGPFSALDSSDNEGTYALSRAYVPKMLV